MNSRNNSTAPLRLYSVRFSRWLWRLIWNRRVGWSLVCLVSLIPLYWQWENWRSAKELAAAHQRLLERIGTDDLVAFSPPKIEDEQNYFALPVVEQWATEPLQEGGIRKRYNIPKHVFLPAGFVPPEILKNDDDGTSRLDFSSWVTNRDLKGELPSMVMNRELGDGNGLLPKLAAGLNRPFSSIIPGLREALELAGDNPLDLPIPNISDFVGHTHDLSLHLRCAAAAHDVVKARQTALITLRLFPESASAYPSLGGCLVSLATHKAAFAALQDALGKSVWNEATLDAMQVQLGKLDDCEQLEKSVSCEMLEGYRLGVYLIGTRQEHSPPITSLLVSGNPRCLGLLARFYGPIGWHHANLAFYIECWLEIIGSKSNGTSLDANERAHAVHKRILSEYASPRRIAACAAFPNIGSIYSSAGKTLFHRRCLIIACALEKHRLKHGAFPESLAVVKDDLKLFKLNDPARLQTPLGYRLENGGYLLWSAGPDAKDDGGVKDGDWLWRMKREP